MREPLEPIRIMLLCHDSGLRAAYADAAAADSGFLLVPETDAAPDAVLTDISPLAQTQIPRLCALRQADVRVFLLMETYDAAAVAYIREAADYLFVMPQPPAAVLRRIRVFLHGCAKRDARYVPEDAWILAQTDACLTTIGVPPHLLGYRYMREGVRYLIDSETPMHLSMMRDIYPAVARVMDTSPVMVDRAMKHAIEVAWRKGNVLMQHVYFGYSSVDKKGMPTNAEWLYAVADRVRILLCDPRGMEPFTQMLEMLDAASDCGLSVDVRDPAW